MTTQEKIEKMLKKFECIINAEGKHTCGECRHYSKALEHCFKYDMEGRGEFHKACRYFRSVQ